MARKGRPRRPARESAQDDGLMKLEPTPKQDKPARRGRPSPTQSRLAHRWSPVVQVNLFRMNSHIE
ncbi:hypothetical protein PIB30_059645 [Stylosanthes scabra]|uniref:Uncharacterized protein n=1 Tax=Stylosanthes scabra TaxID=79078 RepID=A0ABU6QKY4_9FABA|nr:hypothetical protein [Stylosanthes scabra]